MRNSDKKKDRRQVVKRKVREQQKMRNSDKKDKQTSGQMESEGATENVVKESRREGGGT